MKPPDRELAKAAELDREAWIFLLDAALQRPGNELNEEWAWLLDQLGLTLEHYSAILEALRQGRWREARNPRTYLKTVARREAHKEQLAAEAQDNFVLMPTTAEGRSASLEGTLDHVAYVRNAIEACWDPTASGAAVAELIGTTTLTKKMTTATP